MLEKVENQKNWKGVQRDLNLFSSETYGRKETKEHFSDDQKRLPTSSERIFSIIVYCLTMTMTMTGREVVVLA